VQLKTILDALPAFDSLRNLISQIGNPAKSKASAWVFDPVILTQFDTEVIYGSDWLPRKIVDIVPKHATREWRTWQADEAEPLYEAEKALQLKSKLRKALVYDRLYGGGAILIGAQTKNPSRPLDLTKIGKGDLEYIHAFHRWELTEGDLIKDIKDPDFGKPQWYTINADSDLRDVKIHRSRFAFFVSLPHSSSALLSTPSALTRCWGQSILEFVLRAIVRSEATNENASALMEEAKLDVIQVPNLPAQLGNREGQNRLITRFALANQLKSSNSLLLLGGEEKFDRKQISFAGIPELMHAHLQIVAGASEIPLTILLGQAPAGLNATGDNDVRNFYDSVRQFQTTDLQDSLSSVDEALVRSTLGDLPEEVVYEWDPLWQMSEAEKATVSKTKMDSVQVLVNTNLFAQEELRPAVADMLIDDGLLPTLDQHMLSEDEMAQLLEANAQAQQEAQQVQVDPKTGKPVKPPPPPQPQTLKVVTGGKTDADPFDEWEEEEHPRVPSGQSGGGQFAKAGEGSGEPSPQYVPTGKKAGKGAWKGSPIPQDCWPFSASKDKAHHVKRYDELMKKPAQSGIAYRTMLKYFAYEAKYYGLAHEVNDFRQKAAQSYLLQSQELASTDPKKSKELHAKYLSLTAKPGGKKEPELVSTETGNVVTPQPDDWAKKYKPPELAQEPGLKTAQAPGPPGSGPL
jgi:phage-related protein (TIGR01555 family)